MKYTKVKIIHSVRLYRVTPVIRPWPCIRYKAIWRFENFIRPWPCIRYKARGGFVLDIRPWPYNRSNTVPFLVRVTTGRKLDKLKKLETSC